MRWYDEVTVEVGEWEIANGKRSPWNNPLVLAIQSVERCLEVYSGSRVGLVALQHCNCELPADANAKLAAFERGERMEPFSFTLSVSICDEKE